jgi:glycine cleavage system H protein
MNFPEDLLYTNEHEWVRVDGDTATIGITDFAQSELGDIVYVDIEDTTIEESFGRNDVFGSVEAVKTVSDLFMPIAGQVLEINEKLADTPELVNDDPYGEGWMIRIKLEESPEEAELMPADEYKEKVSA